MMLFLLPEPFREIGAWWEDMGSQKLNNSTISGPEVVERKGVAKGRMPQQVRTRTVKSEKRGILCEMAASPAQKTLIYAYYGNTRV